MHNCCVRARAVTWSSAVVETELKMDAVLVGHLSSFVFVADGEIFDSGGSECAVSRGSRERQF